MLRVFVQYQEILRIDMQAFQPPFLFLREKYHLMSLLILLLFSCAQEEYEKVHDKGFLYSGVH